MKHQISHLAVFLCLLLVFNEFGPAHFKRLGKHNLKAASPKTGEADQVFSDRQFIVFKSSNVSSF